MLSTFLFRFSELMKSHIWLVFSCFLFALWRNVATNLSLGDVPTMLEINVLHFGILVIHGHFCEPLFWWGSCSMSSPSTVEALPSWCFPLGVPPNPLPPSYYDASSSRCLCCCSFDSIVILSWSIGNIIFFCLL